MLLVLQIRFHVSGNTLTPAEEGPFEMLQMCVKGCLAANPKERKGAHVVAKVLNITAYDAKWLS